jgi:hypothetical protein
VIATSDASPLKETPRTDSGDGSSSAIETVRPSASDWSVLPSATSHFPSRVSRELVATGRVMPTPSHSAGFGTVTGMDTNDVVGVGTIVDVVLLVFVDFFMGLATFDGLVVFRAPDATCWFERSAPMIAAHALVLMINCIRRVRLIQSRVFDVWLERPDSEGGYSTSPNSSRPHEPRWGKAKTRRLRRRPECHQFRRVPHHLR